MGEPRELTTPVWEMDPPPRLGADERRNLGAAHQREDWVYPMQTLEYPDPEPVLRATPICRKCGEPWRDGCSTIRALQCLTLAEHQRKEARESNRAAQEGLAKIGTLAEWKMNPQNRTLEIRQQIAEAALMLGDVEIIDYSLIAIRREMRAKWHELHETPEQRTIRIFADIQKQRDRMPPLDDAAPPAPGDPEAR